MTSQWSSHKECIHYGKDLQGSAMGVDCVGKWAILAGRRALALIDLDNPKEIAHRITRQSKWDISCVQWNPHASHSHMFMTAVNQRIDLYSWEKETSSAICSLKAHTRAVSAIDWSPFDVNVIASCSVDTYTYLWDIRDPKKPKMTFQSVAGATQVQWNKVTTNLFATTHESDVRIWDQRKPTQSVQYISAHLSKIHGLDWHPESETTLATSSQDSTVRFWNIQSPRRSEGMLNTGHPVWRAKYTPFGAGLVTVVVPQLRRGENSLYLWNLNNFSTTDMHPVYALVGHTDVIMEFQWRKQQEGVKDYQLVTWSKDQSLRIWKIDTNLQKKCGHNIQDGGSETDVTSVEMSDEDRQRSSENLDITPQQKGITTNGFIARPQQQQQQQQPQTLQKEFQLINLSIPNVTIDEMDPIRRSCSVKATCGSYNISMVITFPKNYPNNEPLTFEIISTTLDQVSQIELHKTLSEISRKHVERNINCLEACVRGLQSTLDNMSLAEDRLTPDSEIYNLQQAPIPTWTSTLPYNIGNYNYQDRKVPFPRTSGARFCSAGYLVCFGIPADMKKVSGDSDTTPKALADLAAYGPGCRTTMPSFNPYSRSPPLTGADVLSISNFFKVREKKPRQKPKVKPKVNNKDVDRVREMDKNKNQKKLSKVGPTRIYDVSSLMAVHKYLAEHYILDLNDLPKMCKHNAKEASSVGRKDLIQLWSVISVITDKKLKPSPSPDEGPPWAMLPCGRQLLKCLMDFYSKLHDVQTLAMLCCIFWTKEDSEKSQKSTAKSNLEYVPANTDANITYTLGSSSDSGWTLPVMRIKRSNSWSDSFEDYRLVDEKDPKERAIELEKELHENNCRMLDPALQRQYDYFKKAYAQILYKWGFTNQSAKILKCVTSPIEPHKGVEFCTICYNCNKQVRGAQCDSCKYLALQCAICRIGVRGASNFCLACGHGGHTTHMSDWFKKEEQCPTGCGCLCKLENPMVCS